MLQKHLHTYCDVKLIIILKKFELQKKKGEKEEDKHE